MQNETLTDEQRELLKSTARITVVKAGPGSGKTRVFVEALKREVELAGTSSRMAALSFTNVAQQEIGRRIVHLDREQHFLGTLDSFFLRFVVRPFSNLVGILGGVELVPASVQSSIKFSTVQVGKSNAERVEISEVAFIGGTGDKPILSYKGKWRTERVAEEHIQTVLKEKLKLWRHSRKITHSDSHFLAAAILASPGGPAVIKILAQRFPVLLIDEFQDTNWFHARALMRLLGFEGIRALIVGDPGQSIYEFGGANPANFDEVAKLPGAVVMNLKTTHRCPPAVAAVLSAFRGPAFEISSSKQQLGKAVLLVHSLNTPNPDPQLAQSIRNVTNEAPEVIVLARKEATLQRLAGRPIADLVTGSKVCGRLHLAAQYLTSSDARTAAEIAGQELAEFVLHGQRPTPSNLRAAKISLQLWRASVFRVLHAAIGKPEQSWAEWSSSIRAAIENEVSVLTGTEKPKLGAQIRSASNTGFRLLQRGKQADLEWANNVRFSNVHQVKGAEFDSVVFFVPKTAPSQTCPSVDWWDEDSEERRVAFVAMSRAERILVLSLHKETYKNFHEKHPEFVQTFETRYVGTVE